jgi:hypothetical protein
MQVSVRPCGLIILNGVRVDAAMAGWWDSLEFPKLELPELRWSRFGVILLEGGGWRSPN